MAEPEEHLTMLGAGLSLSRVSTTPTHVHVGMPVYQQWPQGCQEATTTFTLGGPRCFTPQVPEAPAQCCLSTPPPRAAAKLKPPDLCCLENTYFPAVSP